jgi:hypothetical protein
MSKKKCKIKSNAKDKKLDISAYICSKCGLKASEKEELCKPNKKHD